jgi:ATP-dependent RNA helicase DHX36
LYTKERFAGLAEQPIPQIQISDLASVVLQFSATHQQGEVAKYLLDTLDPPSEDALAAATLQLKALSSLTADGEVTSLGRVLYRLGVHPGIGRALILGSLFGCLEPMLIIACHLDTRGLMSQIEGTNSERRSIKQEYDAESETDFAWILRVFREYHAAAIAKDNAKLAALQREKYVRHSGYLDMLTTSQIIHEVLAKLKFLPPPQVGRTVFDSLPSSLNSNRDNMTLIKALLANTVSTEIAVWESQPAPRNWRRWWTDSSSLKALVS